MYNVSKTKMVYDLGKNEYKNWIVGESGFDPKYQGKAEVAMCLGNGYMGIRSATEESYIGQVRNTFVAGSFNKASAEEVTELPNAADAIAIEIKINGNIFSLEKGSYSNYSRSLNLKTGELVRKFDWKNEDYHLHFCFRRIVSMHDRHLQVSEISVKCITGQVYLEIRSGLNGQMTNSGAQHFLEGEKRIFDKQYVQMLQKTTESSIDFVHSCNHSFHDSEIKPESRFEMDRRKVLMVFAAQLDADQEIKMLKTSSIYTSRDLDTSGKGVEEIRELAIAQLKSYETQSFDSLLAASAKVWEDYWNRIDIEIESDDDYNQLAIRFAQYHLLCMTPRHDPRMGIGAKGLSGEGYKGHSFWDTEIFMLPFFSYSLPEIARNLLEYRFNTIGGARKKAKENGYQGAMYPWESAWADDGEVTPVWGAADILTGKATKIWSGFIEQHITSDVAFGVWQYYMITRDEAFMEEMGYEILIDTGIFWSSRLEWNEDSQAYHINNVVGPDEYKEHVNNDAFTNHTAQWCMENALSFYEHIKANKPEVYKRLNQKLNLDSQIPTIESRIKKLYIPQANPEGVIPQDDQYLSLQKIDLSKYKKQEHVGSIFRDYNLDQINKIQVSKQASVVMLMYLLEHKFSHDIKEANYHYYEPLTLHDSSLSLSTHAILAADIDDLELSYRLFRRAAEIDLGPNMKSSDHGIHSASLGGLWQIIVNGYVGARMIDGNLRIQPKLPKSIQSIRCSIVWNGVPLRIKVTRDEIYLEGSGAAVENLIINGSLCINWPEQLF